MNILFLDDSKERTKTFLSRCPSAVCVETAQECIEELKNNEYEILYLDHDLSDQVFIDSSREDTGMEVVRWIVSNNPKINKGIATVMICDWV